MKSKLQLLLLSLLFYLKETILSLPDSDGITWLQHENASATRPAFIKQLEILYSDF